MSATKYAIVYKVHNSKSNLKKHIADISDNTMTAKLIKFNVDHKCLTNLFHLYQHVIFLFNIMFHAILTNLSTIQVDSIFYGRSCFFIHAKVGRASTNFKAINS